VIEPVRARPPCILRALANTGVDIKVEELPEVDAAAYLDNEDAIAAYLTDILERTTLACWRSRWATSPVHAA